MMCSSQEQLTTRLLESTTYPMALCSRWPATRGKTSARSFSKTFHTLIWTDLRQCQDLLEFTTWSLTRFRNQTLSSGKTFSLTSSWPEEQPWWRDSLIEFRSSYQRYARPTPRLRSYQPQITEDSNPGWVVRSYRPWGRSSRCGWASRSMRSMEQLWLRGNVHEW